MCLTYPDPTSSWPLAVVIWVKFVEQFRVTARGFKDHVLLLSFVLTVFKFHFSGYPAIVFRYLGEFLRGFQELLEGMKLHILMDSVFYICLRRNIVGFFSLTLLTILIQLFTLLYAEFNSNGFNFMTQVYLMTFYD